MSAISNRMPSRLRARRRWEMDVRYVSPGRQDQPRIGEIVLRVVPGKWLQDDLIGVEVVNGTQNHLFAALRSAARRLAAAGSLRRRYRATPALNTPMTSKSSREGRRSCGRMIGFSGARKTPIFGSFRFLYANRRIASAFPKRSGFSSLWQQGNDCMCQAPTRSSDA